MGKQQDNVRKRKSQAAKQQRVYIASRVTKVFNSLEGIGDDRVPIRRAERHTQTVQYAGIDEHGRVVAVIREVFIRIDGFDLNRLQTLAQFVEHNILAYNGLEVEKSMAGNAERVRLQIQQEQLRPQLCGAWHELRKLCDKFSQVPPNSVFLGNLCPAKLDRIVDL